MNKVLTSHKHLYLGLIMVSFLVILGVVIFTVKSEQNNPETIYDDDPKLWYSQYSNNVVQSDSEVCNDIGVSMFQKNGTAADAAIAQWSRMVVFSQKILLSSFFLVSDPPKLRGSKMQKKHTKNRSF